MSLALCAIARDEEAFLAGLLESVHGVVDEVVIGIDSRTTDRTHELAEQHGARTFWFDWRDSFALARNLVIERARSDWLLTLDCDEVLLPAGREVLSSLRLDDVPLQVDGFLMLMQETDLLDHELGPPERSSTRLFRNTPDLRYVGRIHEEVRYVPDPPRTWCGMFEGGPHIRHYGVDPTVWRVRDKARRDRRLLHLRLRDNPDDAVAYCYLALMADREGRHRAARTFARRALNCGPRTLHDDRVAQMQQLAGTGRMFHA